MRKWNSYDIISLSYFSLSNVIYDYRDIDGY